MIVDEAERRGFLREEQQPVDKLRVASEIRPFLRQPPDQVIL